jgi:hypothetical protein
MLCENDPPPPCEKDFCDIDRDRCCDAAAANAEALAPPPPLPRFLLDHETNTQRSHTEQIARQ